ncbi:hypothetical protein [Acinetobacter radioresistens]|uniref:hypothetical protein n=1 Tax=Acinetobacter radioresistens TaxID=40216 RepID=UPI0020049669|nr:hypothetical protein [Acinetobacter radioresistens]MCK4108863.1 hypothetical protein [Acinetobacter radioresistens]
MSSTKKQLTENLDTPTSRTAKVANFLTGSPETPDQPVVKVSAAKERKQKAAVRYMQQQGIEDINSIDFTRLNCDIPSDLHEFLNKFSRTKGTGYSSMTEIVIEKLGEFAKQHGFKVKN